MLDTAQILTNVADVNLFSVASEFKIYQGSGPIDFYVRFYQSDRKDRYIPNAAATVKIEFMRSDVLGGTNPSQTVSKTMTTPLADDRSIWEVVLTSEDVTKIVTGGIRITLVEGAVPNQITTVMYNKLSIKKYPNSEEGFC